MSTQSKKITIGRTIESVERKDVVPYAMRNGTSSTAGYDLPENYAAAVADESASFRGMVIDAWSMQIPKEAWEKIKTTDGTGGTSGQKLDTYFAVNYLKEDGTLTETDLATLTNPANLNGGIPTLTGTDAVSYPEWPSDAIVPLLDPSSGLYNPWQAMAECYDQFYEDIGAFGGSSIPCDQLALLIQKLYDELYKLANPGPYSPLHPLDSGSVFGNATAFESKYGNLYIGGFNKTPVLYTPGAPTVIDLSGTTVSDFGYVTNGPIDPVKVNYVKLSVSDEVLAVLNTSLGQSAEGEGYSLTSYGYKPILDKINTGNVVIWCGPCDPVKHKHIRQQELAMATVGTDKMDITGIRMSSTPTLTN